MCPMHLLYALYVTRSLERVQNIEKKKQTRRESQRKHTTITEGYPHQKETPGPKFKGLFLRANSNRRIHGSI